MKRKRRGSARKRKRVARPRSGGRKARDANTTAALGAFLGTYPASVFAAEANRLKATLQAREEAYHRAIASDDVSLLKAFRDNYRKGEDVDQVRARLRALAPNEARASSKLVMAGAAVVAIVVIGAAAAWFTTRPPANSPSTVTAAATPSSASKPPLAVAASSPSSAPLSASAIAAASPAPSPVVPEIKAPPQAATPGPNAAPPKPAMADATPAATPPPDRAAAAWSLLQDTTDVGALQRFTSQFPDSPLRKEAEARMAALLAEQATWSLVKDTKDPEQLRRFIRQFPTSPDRPAAEERIASLSAAPPPAAINTPDPHDLTRLLQFELMRVGCLAGKVSGEFDDDTKAAWHKFVKLTSKNMPDDVSQDAINAVRGVNKRVCPLICARGEHAEGNSCVANEPPPKRAAKRAPVERHEPAPPAPAPTTYCQGRSSGVAVSNGSSYCSN